MTCFFEGKANDAHNNDVYPSVDFDTKRIPSLTALKNVLVKVIGTPVSGMPLSYDASDATTADPFKSLIQLQNQFETFSGTAGAHGTLNTLVTTDHEGRLSELETFKGSAGAHGALDTFVRTVHESRIVGLENKLKTDGAIGQQLTEIERQLGHWKTFASALASSAQTLHNALR